MRSLLRSCALLMLPLVSGAEPMRDSEILDPFFGEALFYAHQGRHFEALQRLDAEMAQHREVDERALDSLHPHIDEARFAVGDFELRYRMHQRAGRAIRSVLEADIGQDVRADATLRLARIHFRKGQADEALRVLDSMSRPVPESMRSDFRLLRAHVSMALGRPEDASTWLEDFEASDALRGFAAYNLGIALLESGRSEEALRQLDRAGRMEPQDRESRAIRDKSNLVLGTLLLESGRSERAREPLDRIPLEGPFSNLALLRAGWAASSSAAHERAIVPWSILVERDPTDPAVQEAMLALPFAYGKLGVHGRAARLYERAASIFGDEIERLDASVESIRQGRLLEALQSGEMRQDADWVIRLRGLPEAPETFYLVDLIASHDFQTALQNYLDLEDLRVRLREWRRSLDALEDLIEHRRRYHEPRLPEIDRAFRQLDARMQLRLQQRSHLADRLQQLLIAPMPRLLATRSERISAEKLDALERALDRGQGASGPAPSGIGSEERDRARIRRLRGVIRWRLETRYHERLTTAHGRLRELNEAVDELERRYESFVRARQAATHSYVGYAIPIGRYRSRVLGALEKIELLQRRQGRMLESVAIDALRTRRERLVAHQNQARFAFADSYDRAVEMQGHPGSSQ